MVVLSPTEFVVFCICAIAAYLFVGAAFWSEVAHWRELHAESYARAKLAEDQLEEWLSAEQERAEAQVKPLSRYEFTRHQ